VVVVGPALIDHGLLDQFPQEGILQRMPLGLYGLAIVEDDASAASTLLMTCSLTRSARAALLEQGA
jgi:hypothetical protein